MIIEKKQAKKREEKEIYSQTKYTVYFKDTLIYSRTKYIFKNYT